MSATDFVYGKWGDVNPVIRTNKKEITRMKKFIVSFVAALAICTICGSAANAQATRTWVSGVGDDANPCSRTAPCKTFAGAISKTAPCGEISVLDPGGYGAVTITKSITINGDGTLAGILAASVNGIIVNAGVNDKVQIRNISINGACSGLDGIRFLGGAQLTVENCNIYGFTGDGIDVTKTAAGNVYVHDTNITRVNGTGIAMTTSAGFIVANLDHVRLEGNGNGVTVGGTVGGNTVAAISNSTVFQNATNGILVSSGGSKAF